jgi:hypothetical protein
VVVVTVVLVPVHGHGFAEDPSFSYHWGSHIKNSLLICLGWVWEQDGQTIEVFAQNYFPYTILKQFTGKQQHTYINFHAIKCIKRKWTHMVIETVKFSSVTVFCITTKLTYIMIEAAKLI